MASSREYLDFILEQLSDLEDITYRAMMGEYIIYNQGKIVGGIYDDRFLVKPTKSAMAMMPNASMELPYDYTIKLAENNDIELTEKERTQTDNSIINLQNYLKIQRHIFEDAA